MWGKRKSEIGICRVIEGSKRKSSAAFLFGRVFLGRVIAALQKGVAHRSLWGGRAVIYCHAPHPGLEAGSWGFPLVQRLSQMHLCMGRDPQCQQKPPRVFAMPQIPQAKTPVFSRERRLVPVFFSKGAKCLCQCSLRGGRFAPAFSGGFLSTWL